MSELSLVIRGVDAVLPSGRQPVDIGVDASGHIAAIGTPGGLGASQSLDGSGLVALPGAIDLHVHINTYFGGATTLDDFYTGTVSALLGGTTTIGQFALPRPDETTIAAVDRTRHEADGQAVADYAIHGALVRDTYDESLGHLAELPSVGVRTVKVFSAYSEGIGLSLGQIHRVLAGAARSGLIVFVHAETDSLVREGIADAVASVGTGPKAHAASRTPLAEADAVRSVCDLAADAGARVYFVHISSAEGAAAIAEQRAQSRALFAETCPHYLYLDEAVYDRPDGAQWICSPPVRSARHRTALWEALARGTIDTVSSDHNCYDIEQKQASADFREIPNGLPGIGYRLPLLIDAATRNLLSWERLAAVSAGAPARVLGLTRRKGALEPGADADIVLVDSTAETDLGTPLMGTDYSPYVGVRTRGRIVRVLRRGEWVVDEHGLRAERGSGLRLALQADPAPRQIDHGTSAGLTTESGPG